MILVTSSKVVQRRLSFPSASEPPILKDLFGFFAPMKIHHIQHLIDPRIQVVFLFFEALGKEFTYGQLKVCARDDLAGGGDGRAI